MKNEVTVRLAVSALLMAILAVSGCSGAPAANPTPSPAATAAASPFVPPSPQPALEAKLDGPRGLAFDSAGNLYVSECQWTFAAVEKIDPNGVVTRFAGTGMPGFSGDGGPATSAQLYCPAGIAVGPDGAVYFADHVNNRVRRVDAAGVITTFAGSGPAGLNQGTFSGDGGLATEAALQEPWGVAFDQTGRLYIADRDNARIRRVDLDGVISTVAGSGARGSAGDGSQAIEAEICPPNGLAIDPSGNLIVLESCTNKVRSVGADGVITTIAGTGSDGFSGDGGPATLAEIGSPDNAVFDGSGAMFLLSGSHIRRIDAGGVITTIAGNGDAKTPTEGSAALLSALGIEAWGLAFDATGNLYFADGGDGVFLIDDAGTIVRFAGQPPQATAPPTASPTASPTPMPSPTPAPVLFRAPVPIELPGDPGATTSGDFNGDGNTDLVTANGDGTVTLLVGNGAGIFEVIDLEASLSADSGPASIAAADLNGDGRLDVVIAHTGVSDKGTGTDDIVVLLAKNTHFEKLVRPAGVNAQAIAIGDFNHDQKADLATANEGDYVSVFLGAGDGTFNDPVNSPSGADFSSGLSAADFNGDGDLDVVTANSLVGRGRSAHTVSVLLGLGDGSFDEPIVAPVGGPQPVMPVTGDLNGDGSPDVVTPNGDPSHEVSVLLGLGDGHLGESIQYRAGADAHSLVLADLNGDGNLDIVAWNSGVLGGQVERGLSVLFGAGDGTFGSNIDAAQTFEAEVAVVADLDGDGRPDVVLQGIGQLLLFFSTIDQHGQP